MLEQAILTVGSMRWINLSILVIRISKMTLIETGLFLRKKRPATVMLYQNLILMPEDPGIISMRNYFPWILARKFGFKFEFQNKFRIKNKLKEVFPDMIPETICGVCIVLFKILS